jgi:DNA-binding NarL/FixJ family response regulator
MFLDGLVAILEADERLEIVCQGSNIREIVRRAALTSGSVVVVDTKGLVPKDFDYLIGAQEFGQFGIVALTDGKSSHAHLFQAELSREDRGADLVKKILAMLPTAPKTTNARVLQLADARATGEVMAKRGRGRPREFTNNMPLSAREYQAAALVASGLTNREIADAMGIKAQSAKNLVVSVSRKLGCRTRVAVAEHYDRAKSSTALL